MGRAKYRPAHRELPASVRLVPVLAVILALLVVISPVSAGGSGGRGTHAPAAGKTCPGARGPGTANGTLVLVGNSTPLPSVSGASVRVDYFYTAIETIGGSSSESCVLATASGTTGAGGSLSVGLALPPNRCLPTACIQYLGPYGPLSYTTSGAPAGFVERDPTGGTSPGTIAWDARLYAVALNLTGMVVVSTDAPVRLSASSWDALGAPASGPVAYHWHVAGLGWSNSSPIGPNITVEGTDSGWPGSISVTAVATFGSTTESVLSPDLSLQPVATRVTSASASPAPVDPGVPVTFDVVGTGAAGYSYAATVDPGLGAGPVTGVCASTRLPNGTANLNCPLRAAYPTAGTATPTASLTNGYSAAAWTLNSLAVHPVEQVSLHVPRFVTYPNLTQTLSVNVTNGTGSAPYGPVCLTTGGTPGLTCLSSNDSVWAFPVEFPAPGEYQLQASVVDRFGENVSASAVVLVVPFLSARVSGSSILTVAANQTTPLSVVVAGGALPISTWWNASRSQSFLCAGSLEFDGMITCQYHTSTPGPTNLTVTLRDALGSETTVLFRITVTPGAAHLGPPGGFALTGSSGWVLVGALTALAAGGLLVAWDVRRRRRDAALETTEARVEENELERMARGRDHLLSNADPALARRPDELVAGWTGPPVAPEEWAEWIAALVADGSLVPSRSFDRRLVYRRPAPRPSTPTIQFDPTALPRGPTPFDEAPDPAADPPGDYGGG